jgi:hypothetical protein
MVSGLIALEGMCQKCDWVTDWVPGLRRQTPSIADWVVDVALGCHTSRGVRVAISSRVHVSQSESAVRAMLGRQSHCKKTYDLLSNRA